MVFAFPNFIKIRNQTWQIILEYYIYVVIIWSKGEEKVLFIGSYLIHSIIFSHVNYMLGQYFSILLDDKNHPECAY